MSSALACMGRRQQCRPLRDGGIERPSPEGGGGRGLEELPTPSGSQQQRQGPAKNEDPRRVLPHALTRESFELKFPFMEVYNDMRYMTEEQDKCGDNMVMEYETITEFKKYLGPCLVELFDSWQTEGLELATRPIHAGFLHEIRKLASVWMDLKRSRKEEAGTQKEEKNEESGLEGMRLRVAATEEEEDEEGGGGGGSYGSSNSSKEGLKLYHEPSSKSSSGKGYGDFFVRAFDKAFLKDNNLLPGDPAALRTTMVLEPKGTNIEKVWKNGPGGVYQAGDYAIAEGFINVQKGRRSPIYLMTWSKHQWSYGVLIMDDIVTLSERGEVLGRSDLQPRFNVREKNLKKYLCNKDARYDANDYLVWMQVEYDAIVKNGTWY